MSTRKWLMMAMVLCSTVSLSKAVTVEYIDNFSDGDLDIEISGPPFVESTEVGLFEVMGGERYSRIDYSTGTASASLMIDPFGAGMLLNSDAGVTATFTLVYGMNNDLNEDFSVATPQSVFVDWAGWTDDAAEVSVILLNNNGGGANQEQAQVKKTTTGGPAAQVMDFTFAQFLADNPSMAFDDIDRVVFQVVGRPGWDGIMEAGSIYIPEPASMTLLGIAGMALIRRRRRR